MLLGLSENFLYCDLLQELFLHSQRGHKIILFLSRNIAMVVICVVMNLCGKELYYFWFNECKSSYLLQAFITSPCKEGMNMLLWMLSGSTILLNTIFFKIWLLSVCLEPGKQQELVEVRVWFYTTHTHLVFFIFKLSSSMFFCFIMSLKYFILKDFSWAYLDFSYIRWQGYK